MKTRYISSFILLAALGFSAPAMAHCQADANAGSTTQSCESGVKVYRGKQSGPDIRYVILKQNRDIAESNARAVEARARIEEARRTPIIRPQNNSATRRSFRRSFLLPGGAFGFQNFGGTSAPQAGSRLSQGGFSGRIGNGGFTGRITTGSARFLPGPNSRVPVSAAPLRRAN